MYLDCLYNVVCANICFPSRSLKFYYVLGQLPIKFWGSVSLISFPGNKHCAHINCFSHAGERVNSIYSIAERMENQDLIINFFKLHLCLFSPLICCVSFIVINFS